MQLLFADETEKLKQHKKLFFCICSLAIEEGKVLAANASLNQICEKYGIENLKDGRRSGLSESIRIEISNEVAQVLMNAEAKVRAILIGPYSLRTAFNKAGLYVEAMSFIIERWQCTLFTKNERGIVIFDSMDDKLERNFGLKFSELIATEGTSVNGKSYGNFKDYIHPTLMFAADENSRLIQAADCIGTALNSAYFNSLWSPNFEIKNLPNENKFLNIYWPLFMRSPEGRVRGYGIKIWN